MAAILPFIKLRAYQVTKLAFHDAIVLVSVIDHLAAEFDILFEWLVAGIHHDAGESFVDAFLAQLE